MYMHILSLFQDGQQRRIHDLEDNVRSLRKLLSSRETEVHELAGQLADYRVLNQSLKDELEIARTRLSAGSRGHTEEEVCRHP